MKTKRILAALMAALMLLFCVIPAGAADVSKIDEYKAGFKAACGPDVDGIATDYMYFVPKNISANKKYPLVVYFHGMGQGSAPGAQIQDNNIALWASDEMQARFTNGGAYLFVPRTHEENREYWENNSIKSVKAAIDEFIANNKNIDTTRIYVGGFSMGGKMTLKMATSYPDFFAAAFPMCPAYNPTDEQLEAIADMPVWLIVSRYDILAGYYVNSKNIWKRFCTTTDIPEDCRLSLFGVVHYPDGKKTVSNHHVWFAASNDMFMYDGSDYVKMETTDANGETVKLEYPDGLISWLCSYRSDYNGQPTDSTGLCEQNRESMGLMVLNILKSIFLMFADAVGSLFR